MEALALITALGCGLNAGVFFAFSTFVMQGLARLRPADGVAAMQSINVTALRPPFMVALFGTAALCVAAVVAGGAAWSEPYGPWLVAGGALYLTGTIALTAAYHVPRNNALAAVAPGSADADRLWARYLAQWTGANHVRTAAALAAAACLFLGALAS